MESEDVEHFMDWMNRVCEGRRERHPDRIPQRTYDSITQTFLRILKSLPDRQRYRDFIPRNATSEMMRRIVATCFLVWSQRRATSPGVQTTQDFCKRWRHMVVNGVRSGFFSNAEPGAVKDALQYREVMTEANTIRSDADGPAMNDPDLSTPVGCAKRPAVRVEEVRALLAAGCKTFADRTLVTLLYTAAPRIAAITNIRIRDVWDDRTHTVRSRVRLLEKGSRERIFVPRKPLIDELTKWMNARIHQGDAFLFGSACRGKRVSTRSLSLRLAQICKRAGVRPINPHSFRSFVVNQGVSKGLSVEHMARFMGHQDVTTTRKHYLTDTMDANILGVMAEAARTATTGDNLPDDIAQLRSQLAAAEAELAELRRQVVEDESDGGPSRTFVSVEEADALFARLAQP